MDAALDDVFVDEISFPATDGYALSGTLFLPRGTKRHAVLINSATAALRKIYRGFASYLAHRGCAVLTYDYRGIGDSRLPAMVGYNQPKSLVGFQGLDVGLGRARRHRRSALDARALQPLPLAYVGHSFGGQALG
ncbi:putative alpha/beta hydrolase [Bradyrhizobium sp. LB7.1]